MAWNPEVYDKFKKERSQPFFDLLSLTERKSGISVIDLGCGTGELTSSLPDFFQNSKIKGIDSSPEMLEKSRQFENPQLHFEKVTIEQQIEKDETYDVIISNAALQWCENHQYLFPKIISMINNGGQLAVQMPSNHHFIVHQLLNKISENEMFRSTFNGWKRQYSVLNTEDYAKILVNHHGSSINVFEKVYPHIMENASAVFQWASSTAMIPYSDTLPEDLKEKFRQQYLQELQKVFPESPVFYPFKKIFVYAKF